MPRCGRSLGLGSRLAAVALATMAMVQGAAGADILQTIGFSNCGPNANIQVQKVDIQYNNENKTVSFDVAGSSSRVQNVTAVLNVTAYGQQVYSNTFNPCAKGTFVSQLCPVPAGSFSARGSQVIPPEFVSALPAIAFQIPDIAALATLQLKALDSGRDVACIKSQVSNGKTANVPAVSYVAAGVAGAALVMTGVTAIGAAVAGGSGAAAGGSAAGVGTISPSFTEVFGWFQGMAMNGMLSVSYPQVYRSFAKNFAFSTGLVQWTTLQESIDQFRNMTGGNLTADSVATLRNATLVYPDGSISTSDKSQPLKLKRALDSIVLLATRDIQTSVNTTAPAAAGEQGVPAQFRMAVTGIQAYASELAVPSANTFMTVLLIVAIVIAAIAVGILLFKLILEFWALFGNFPKSLIGFRKHYWGSIARAITSLILLLYGVWVLYCIFQFTHGDSWAAKTLAGITLGLFTGVLVFFSFKIWYTARQLRNVEGDASGLYEKKNIWVKYSMFYESYKKDYWWIFVPTIIYLFAKGTAIAVGNGHGMIQTISLLVIEGIMLILLLWSRPYERKSGNVVNVAIAVVRVLSVVVILVFVQEFGIAQTTQTVAGVVLIVIQSVLTGILAILIAWNAISACCKANPHRQRRKELEKMRDMDNLTPLDARNSLLIDRSKLDQESSTTFAVANTVDEKKSMSQTPYQDRYSNDAANPYSNLKPSSASDSFKSGTFRPLTPSTPLAYNDDSKSTLLSGAAPIGRADSRQPTLPVFDSGPGYNAPRANNSYSSGPGYGGGYASGGYGQGGYGQASYNQGGYGYGAPPRGY
ncbi:hypothetical protein MAPG_06733 [Magnaporthiopsis poae ATCC 64411]|uniref:ML-like domain-containing protein n=1 Tax=Magnaporthiopsis poae (strain ATCC 64411 / 73-15) TaxID=644358 RepID=A0A0C4E2U3_MAGP6|nr:hypothetical protein MAPG_06733 [Magnaporthiopsis poae ATCC 64411]